MGVGFTSNYSGGRPSVCFSELGFFQGFGVRCGSRQKYWFCGSGFSSGLAYYDVTAALLSLLFVLLLSKAGRLHGPTATPS